jgi:hypothetical protein
MNIMYTRTLCSRFRLKCPRKFCTAIKLRSFCCDNEQERRGEEGKRRKGREYLCNCHSSTNRLETHVIVKIVCQAIARDGRERLDCSRIPSVSKKKKKKKTQQNLCSSSRFFHLEDTRTNQWTWTEGQALQWRSQ